MDKGFYSKPNNNFFIDNNYMFSTVIPFTSNWIVDIVKRNKEDISNVRYYSNEFNLYSKTIPYNENNITANVHLYFDHARKVSEEKHLNRAIQDSLKLLNSIKDNQENKNTTKYSIDDINSLIKRNNPYFDITKQ